MENGIIRVVATLCAMGSTALLWILGAFVVVPWHEGRMTTLNLAEIQMIVVPLVVGLAATWGVLHLFALADKTDNPRTYAVIRAVVIAACFAAVIGGGTWTLARIA
jgi:hypothetical protein